MKKIVIASIVAALLIAGGFAINNVTAEQSECPQGQQWNTTTNKCEVVQSRSLQLIIEGYCKPGAVEYTEWSECDKRFGKNGFQYRDIVLPTKNGCVPSTLDQIGRQRECLK